MQADVIIESLEISTREIGETIFYFASNGHVSRNILCNHECIPVRGCPYQYIRLQASCNLLDTQE